jgi:hypothetical protein
LIKEKIRVDLQRFLRKRSGLRPFVLPGGDGDLMASSALSRRVSEFLGVLLFAAATESG